MGEHYIPQYYLKGFSSSVPNRIWVYDRKYISDPKYLPISEVAQEKTFYGKITERYLEKVVEAPANKVLNKIRNLQPITISEKYILSKYIFKLYMRVPKSQKRFEERLKISIDNEKVSYDKRFEKVRLENIGRSEEYRKYQEWTKKYLENFKEDPPKEIWWRAIRIDNADSVSILSNINWTFLINNTSSIFLTSDNPVFFHAPLGIGKLHSDLSFPISSNIALLAVRWADNFRYCEATPEFVEEVNARTVGNSSRFIFGSTNASWISDLMKKNIYDIRLLAKLEPALFKNN